MIKKFNYFKEDIYYIINIKNDIRMDYKPTGEITNFLDIIAILLTNICLNCIHHHFQITFNLLFSILISCYKGI